MILHIAFVTPLHCLTIQEPSLCESIVPSAISTEDVPALLNLLFKLAGCWQLFLGQLGVPKWKVDEIQLARANSPNSPTLCLSDGLDYWLKSSENPTYLTIVRVLYSEIVCNLTLAKRLELHVKEKHGAEGII